LARRDDAELRRDDEHTAAVLGAIATGFPRQKRAITLAQQHAIHSALLGARDTADKALRISENRYRAVVTQAAEGIILADAPTGRIMEVNQAFQDMLGYTAGELVGRRLHEISAHGRDSVEAEIRLALRNGCYAVSQRPGRRKDGRPITVEASGTTVAVDGRVLLSIIVRDVTEKAELTAERGKTCGGRQQGGGEAPFGMGAA